MRVCYFGAYIPDSLRNQTLKKGLKDIGIDVIECNTSVRVKIWRQYIELIRKYIFLDKEFDAFFIPEFTQSSMPLAWLIKQLSKKPIIFDPDTSLYFSSVYNRKTVKENSFKAKCLWRLDKLALNLADIVTVTTQQNYAFFKKNFGVNEAKMRLIYFGVDDNLFYPRQTRNDDGIFRIIFWGNYIPGHGIEYILKAAKLLEEEKDIRFELYGRGQTFEYIENLHKELELKNLFLSGSIAREDIPNVTAMADICLGIFGDTEQINRCISDKILEIMALRKPLLTAKYPAYATIFNDGEHCLFCDRANPGSLRDAILCLKNNKELRDRISEAGYRLIKERFSSTNIGKRLKEVIEECLG